MAHGEIAGQVCVTNLEDHQTGCGRGRLEPTSVGLETVGTWGRFPTTMHIARKSSKAVATMYDIGTL